MPIFTNRLFFLVGLTHASRSSFDLSMPSTDRLVPAVAYPPIVSRYPQVLGLKWHEPDAFAGDVHWTDIRTQGF